MAVALRQNSVSGFAWLNGVTFVHCTDAHHSHLFKIGQPVNFLHMLCIDGGLVMIRRECVHIDIEPSSPSPQRPPTVSFIMPNFNYVYYISLYSIGYHYTNSSLCFSQIEYRC